MTANRFPAASYLDGSYTHCDVKSPADVSPKAKTTLVREKPMATRIFTGMKLLVLQILFRGKKLSQYHFLAVITRSLSRKSTEAKCKADNDPLLVHLENSISQNACKSQSISPESQ
jgi:hypothetical protein